MKTAKLFKNGKNQAVRLPREFEFEGINEVIIRKEGDNRRSRACAARAREPWLLATSLPVTTKLAKQVVRLYRLRMSIEEGFRDMKSHQFGLG